MINIKKSVLSKVNILCWKRSFVLNWNKKENESTGLDYQQLLAGLTDDQVNKLAELKSEEMDMFGYTFDKSTLAFSYED